jgi:hypothetical protein
LASVEGNSPFKLLLLVTEDLSLGGVCVYTQERHVQAATRSTTAHRGGYKPLPENPKRSCILRAEALTLAVW